MIARDTTYVSPPKNNIRRCRVRLGADKTLPPQTILVIVSDAQQIVGRERRERVSHKAWRLRLNEIALPGQLQRWRATKKISNRSMLKREPSDGI